jgi:transposase
MPIVADFADAVVGGDTHKDSHTLEMLAPSGARIAAVTVSNDGDGFARAIAWIGEHASGPRVVVGLEGTRSYGIGLARAVSAAGLTVVEVERPKRAQRRGRGKSDPIDAHLAAMQVLGMDSQRLPIPRADGPREALRILLTARYELTGTQTRQINQLRALLLTGQDSDRQLCHGKLSLTWLNTIARRRGNASETTEQSVRRQQARRLARNIRDSQRELAANNKQLRHILTAIAPGLLTKHGVGAVSAAQTLVSWSHPGRCRNEAAFAALAGVNPIPASSGRTTRHRLNRGGDRDLNRALHTIALTRWRTCPRTATYIARRRAQGKTDREIRRILKRYIARELYRTLNAT